MGLDAATAARIDRQNRARVQRAWEVLRATGRALADWQDATPPPLLPLAQATALVMTPEVDWLNARITTRFDQMLAAGRAGGGAGDAGGLAAGGGCHPRPSARRN